MDFSGFSMLDLFRTEIESQTQALTDGLIALEQNPRAANHLESLMRASHSIKGAARMVDVGAVVRISHVMEDCFVAAQKGKITLNSQDIDHLLKSVDVISSIARSDDGEIERWENDHGEELNAQVAFLSSILAKTQKDTESLNKEESIAGSSLPDNQYRAVESGIFNEQRTGTDTPSKKQEADTEFQGHAGNKSSAQASAKSRVLRVSADRMDRLLGLAGQAVIESRWLRPYLEAMLRHKRFQYELVSELDKLRDMLNELKLASYSDYLLAGLQQKIIEYREQFSSRLAELEHFDHRTSNLAGRLHNEVVASRMRPFSDGVEGFQRMTRDVARSLGKDVRLDILGLSTQVDRDVLELIKTPLNHLLRNAVDHGIEMPDDREKAGKSRQGIIRLKASHRAGMLSVSVTDDGKGVDLVRLRQKITDKGLANKDMVDMMSDVELMDFMFLPGFSTRDNVSEISGRGVGLDVVHDAVKDMRGVVTATSKPGKGVRFHMQLPLTLSVIRTLLVDIGGECYAFPLSRIDHLLKFPKNKVELLEDRQYVSWNDKHYGLVVASQLFGLNQLDSDDDYLSIIVISDRHSQYGVIVDSFLGERELAVQVIDSRLKKVKDISVAALLDDGTPTLVIDVDDLVRSIDKLVSGGRISKHEDQLGKSRRERVKKRILVIDDSITVREVQRNLLETYGYEVDVAVDGMDGWNAVRSGSYELVITDVDMPRMNGIELVQLIKQDNKLKDLPVMIVSYKDQEEDKRQGLNAGADYYLTKGSFHDESLRDAVLDLIGESK